MAASARLPVVGVMGSGSKEHPELSEPLGRFIAERGCHLLTGAGQGVMAAVSRAFHGVPGRRGLVLGIVPGLVDQHGQRPLPGYPNPWIEVAIHTHLPLSGRQGTEPMSRNHINVLSSDLVVALPGGAGTRSEIELALRYHRPVVALWPPPAVPLEARPPALVVARDLAEIFELLGGAVEGLRIP